MENVTNTVSTTRVTTGGFFQYLAPVTSRFVQNVIRKVPSPIWVSARRKAAHKILGETAPYFALVGVTLVSGPERGLLTEKDEAEALCGDIRVSKDQYSIDKLCNKCVISKNNYLLFHRKPYLELDCYMTQIFGRKRANHLMLPKKE